MMGLGLTPGDEVITADFTFAATVEVTLADGSVLTKPFVSGESLCSDPSHVLVFGLGDQQANEINVTYIDGDQQALSGNWRNDSVTF